MMCDVRRASEAAFSERLTPRRASSDEGEESSTIRSRM